MDELDELLSQAIDAGASDADLKEIANLYYARVAGEKKKDPLAPKPYSGAGSMDYSPVSNPLVQGVSSAKEKASKPKVEADKKEEEPTVVPFKEREYLDLDKVKTSVVSPSDALYKPKFEQEKIEDKSIKTLEQKDAYINTQKERGIVRNPVKKGMFETEESFMDRQIDTMQELMVGESPTHVFDDWASKAGTRSMEFPTTEKMSSEYVAAQKQAVFDDYLEYLVNNGEEEKANQYKSTYDALTQRQREGSIGVGEQAKLNGIQSEAFQKYNHALTNKIYAIEATSDMDAFKKNTTIVEGKITSLLSEMEKLGEPKTQKDVDRYNALVAKYESLVRDVDGIRDATGFTSDKEMQLRDAYTKLIDGTQYDEHSKSLNPEYYKDQEELSGVRAAEAINEMESSNGVLSMAGEAANTALGAAWLTFGNAVLSIAQLPKIMGDKTGDTDYDIFDSIYDSIEGQKDLRSAYLGAGEYGEGVERPSYLHVADVIGSAVGSMASMMAPARALQAGALRSGMALTKADKLGKIASGLQTYQMSLPDNYNTAIAAGKDQKTAAFEASLISLISALVEQGVPDVPHEGIIETGLRVYRETGDFAKALKTSAMRYSEAALINEPLEEFMDVTAANITKQSLGGYDDVWGPQEYIDSFIGAAGAAGIMTALNRGSKDEPLHPDEKLVNRYVAENAMRLVPQMVQVSDDPNEMALSGKRIKEATETLDKLKSNSSWDSLTGSEQDDAFDFANRAEMLRAKIKDSKSLGVADPYSESELLELEAELQVILTPKEDVAPAPEAQKEQDFATQDVNIKDEVLPTPTELLIANTEEVAKDERTEIEQTTEVEADVQQQGDESGAIQSETDGGGDGLRDTGIDEPIDEGSPRDIKGLIFAEDEEIGRVLFGGDGIEPDGGMASGEVDMGGDKGDANVLPSEGEPNGDGSVSEEPVRVDVLGNGEDIKNLSERTTKVRAKLISKVNSLIDMASTYNGLGKKGRDTPVGKKMRERIEQDAKKMGLDYNFLGNKIKIGYKGKPIRKKGTTRGKSNEVEIISRARKMRSNGERQTDNLLLDIAEMFLTKTKKDKGGITPYLFGSLTMLDKDTEEYKNAVSMGWVDENGEGDLDLLTSSLNSHYNDNYDPDQVSDILSLVLGAGSRGALKAMVAENQLDFESKMKGWSDENLKADAQVDEMIESAINEYQKTLDELISDGNLDESSAYAYDKKEEVKAIIRNQNIRKVFDKDGESLINYAISEYDKRIERVMPFDSIDDEDGDGISDEDYSNVPFQESEDPFVEAVNIFSDAYENGDLVSAVRAAKEFLATIDDGGAARRKFLEYLQGNKDVLVAGKKKEKELRGIANRKDFKDALRVLLPQISDEDAERLAVVGDAMVKYAMNLDSNLSSEDAWGYVQGAMTNDIEELTGNKLGQPKANESEIGDGTTAKEGNKVVDRKGNPITVYHGASIPRFSRFSLDKVGFGNPKAIFFTSSRENAKVYSRSDRDVDEGIMSGDTELEYGSGGAIYTANIIMKNPLIIDAKGKKYDDLTNVINKKRVYDVNDVVFLAQSLGYDGVVVKNVKDSSSHTIGDSILATTYAVFSPDQIVIRLNKSKLSEENNTLLQGVKGATSIDQGITAYTEAADVSTLIHEPAHNFMGLLLAMSEKGNAKAQAHLKAIDDFAASEQGKKFFERSRAAGESWTKGKEYDPTDATFKQELFARSSEKYFMEGNKSGFSARMMEVFDSFAKFLNGLYKGVKNSPEFIELSPDMRSLFDALYGKEETAKIDTKNTGIKLRNVIRAYVENSNLPKDVKKKLANDPRNVAHVFTFKEMEALVDGLIAQFGVDAVLDEAMKESSSIPLSLRSAVFGRALVDLRTRIENAKGQEKIDLDERYLDVHATMGFMAHEAGVFNAYFYMVYNQDPRAVAKSMKVRLKKAINNASAVSEMESDAKDVETILDASEDMASVTEAVVEDMDVVDAIKEVDRLQKKVDNLEKKITKLGKQEKVIATQVTLKKLGKDRSEGYAKRVNRMAELKKEMARNKNITMSSALPINPIVLAQRMEYGLLYLTNKGVDFVSFAKALGKDLGEDFTNDFGDIYKNAKAKLAEDGYDVSSLTNDGDIDELMDAITQKKAALIEQKKQAQVKSARDSFAKNIDAKAKRAEKLRKAAQAYMDLTGDNSLNEIVDNVEAQEKEISKSKDKEAKQRELDNYIKRLAKESATKTSDLIKKALIDLGFTTKDANGNNTTTINWKAIVKDSKDVNETVSKIMEAIKSRLTPSEYSMMESFLHDKLQDEITNRKAKAVENFLKNREGNALRKLWNKHSRPSRIDKLMALFNMGGLSNSKVKEAISQEYGVVAYSLEDEKYIDEWAERRARAIKIGSDIDVAELDEEMQKFQDSRANPHLSVDKIMSDLTQGMLASPLTSMQNMGMLQDTAFYSPLFDLLYAQFSRGKVGDKYAAKMVWAAYKKAANNALDQLFGGIDTVSAQAGKTGNREGTPSVRHYEWTRADFGDKSLLARGDKFKQWFVRVFPRLNTAADSFGHTITMEGKMYILLKAKYQDEGMTSSDAAKSAWEAMNGDGFRKAYVQAKGDHPNETSKVRLKRYAYEIMESSAFKEGGEEIFKDAQMNANLTSLKATELGVVSPIFSYINYLLQGMVSAAKMKTHKSKEDGIAIHKLYKSLEFVSTMIHKLHFSFIKPSANVLEQMAKYATYAHPVMAGYAALRIGGLYILAMKGVEGFDYHRATKDLARGVGGYLLLAALLGADDDDEEEDLFGAGPTDKKKQMAERDESQYKSLNGVSFKFFGILELALNIRGYYADRTRFHDDGSGFDLATSLLVGSQADQISRSIDNLKSKDGALARSVLTSPSFLISPWARTMNDLTSMVQTKRKHITTKDFMLKSLGMNILVDHAMVDNMGNEYFLGRNTKYSLDSFVNHIYENIEKDMKVSDYTDKYNVSLNAYVDGGFVKFYDKDLLEVNDERMRYEVGVSASKYRGTAFRSYVDQHETPKVTFPTSEELANKLENSSPTQKEKYSKNEGVFVKKRMMNGDVAVTFVDVTKSVYEDAIKQSKIKGISLEEQLPISYLEGVVSKDFTDLNTAAKRVARYDYAKAHNLDVDNLFNWGEVSKDIELLSEYGVKFD